MYADTPELPRQSFYYGLSRIGKDWILVKGTRHRKGLQYETVFKGPDFDALQAQSVQAELIAGKTSLVSGVASRDSLCRHLETPFPSMKKARKVFPGLLDVQLPFPVESCLTSFTGIEASRSSVRTVAVAAKKETLQSLLSTLSHHRLDPVTLDHEAIAAWDQVHREYPLTHDDECRITCLVSPTDTLLVLGTNEAFAATAGIAAGSEKLFADDEETRARARKRWLSGINQCLQAWRSHLEEPFDWAWACPDANQARELNDLMDSLALAPDSTVFVKDPETLVPRAYINRALHPGNWSCNLRTGDLESAANTEARGRKTARAACMILAAGILLGATGFIQKQLVQVPTKRMDKQIRSLAQELSGIPSVPGQEVLIVERELEKKASLTKPFREAIEQSRAQVLRSVLLAGREAGILFQQLELSGKTIKIEGATDDWNRCDHLVKTLEDLDFGVLLKRDPAGSDELVHFTLEGGPDA